MTCTHYNFPVPEEKMVRVITDTDLCNEADDPFAVVQALLSPKFDNVGVVAAHFGTRDPNGMQKSWQGLKDLTVLMQLTVPVLHGAPHALPDAATPVPSEGAQLLIRERGVFVRQGIDLISERIEPLELMVAVRTKYFFEKTHLLTLLVQCNFGLYHIFMNKERANRRGNKILPDSVFSRCRNAANVVE